MHCQTTMARHDLRWQTSGLSQGRWGRLPIFSRPRNTKLTENCDRPWHDSEEREEGWTAERRDSEERAAHPFSARKSRVSEFSGALLGTPKEAAETLGSADPADLFAAQPMRALLDRSHRTPTTIRLCSKPPMRESLSRLDAGNSAHGKNLWDRVCLAFSAENPPATPEPSHRDSESSAGPYDVVLQLVGCRHIR